MHTALLERSLIELKAVRTHIIFSAKLRGSLATDLAALAEKDEQCQRVVEEFFKDTPEPTSWRVIDHCSTVTRSYAIYEAFVLQLLKEYLAFLTGSYTFSQLGDDLKTKYVRGIGQLLADHDRIRNQHIDVSALIASMHTALGDASEYQLQSEALFRAEQNLRMSELQRLFAQCGLSGLDQWVKSHAAVSSFFSEESRLSDTPESELLRIVQHRNEASHGEVDEVLGTEVLIEITEFFSALCKCLTDYIQYNTLKQAISIGKAKVIGTISKTYSNDIVIAKIEDTHIKTGDPIYINGKGVTMIGEIKSIQLEGVDAPEAEIGEELEVGLRLGVRAKAGCDIIQFF